MALSINEILARQAKKNAAANRVAPRHDAPKGGHKSAAQIMAEQKARKAGQPVPKNSTPPAAPAPKRSVADIMAAQQAKQAARPVSKYTPPPDPAPVKKSVAEIMADQQTKMEAKVGAKPASPSAGIDLNKLKSEYAIYVKNLMAELNSSGPMFFVPKDEPLKSEPAVETKVNGISTAEGEMVVEAQPSVQVGSMPYQATPVITETQKPARRTRKKKADEAPAETEA